MGNNNLQKVVMIYQSFANLYGAIDSDNAYEFVKEYVTNVSKADFLNDMLVRANNKNDGYVIHKYDVKHFIIYSDIYSLDEVEELIANQKGEYYQPLNIDEFLSYHKNLIWYNSNFPVLKECRHVVREIIHRSNKEEAFILNLKRMINLGRNENEFLLYLESIGIHLEDHEIVVKKLIGLFHELEIYSKKHILKGFSIREIWKQKGEL